MGLIETDRIELANRLITDEINYAVEINSPKVSIDVVDAIEIKSVLDEILEE